MLSYKSTSFRIILLFACGLGIVVFKSSGLGRQAQIRTERTSSNKSVQADANPDVVRLSAPAKPARGAGFKGGNPAPFDAASSANVELQSGLEWNFGGKTQRGWGLYTPLIGQLIGAGDDATTGEFAMRLSLWQRENNLEPSGMLDSETWSRMISRFQSRRSLARLRSDQSLLVTIPVTDCYDPMRAEELRSAERDTFAAYKRMVAAAAADSSLGLRLDGAGQLASSEKLLKIVSAYRSREHQERLRHQSPKSGRAGLAVNSPHFTGRALDLYVGGEPVSTKDENRALQTQGSVYRWLVKNAGRFGFQPYFYEPWHWEFVGVRTNPE
jgi:zinc D-Ala-D-Ala carboxypeptidase